MPTNLRSIEPDDPFVGYSIDALYEFLCGYTLVRPIGSVYEYSNLGYGLLGHAPACRADRSYDALLSQRVLQPLAMKTTGMSASVSVDGMAAPHDEANRLVPVMDFGALAPSGALLSTASDMVRFAIANLDSAPGPLRRVLAATHFVHRSVGHIRIGLGWHIRRITDWDAVSNSGETRGSRSFIALDLQTSRSVIVLSNSTGHVEDIGFHTLDARVQLEQERASITLAISELDRYVGTYDLADGGTVAISRKDDQLIAQATGLGGAPIYPASRTEFFVKAIPVQLTSKLDPSGTPTE